MPVDQGRDLRLDVLSQTVNSEIRITILINEFHSDKYPNRHKVALRT